MKEFKNRIGVITGAGTGMGRQLAIKLAALGCHVAICDVLMDNLAETEKAARKTAIENTLVTTHECDVSDESQVLAFCQAVKDQHSTDRINLLFNNAGVGGAGSFVMDPRDEWDRVFGIDWFGVYYCTRAFMPMLLAADEGHIINTSSVNGFWACLGPDVAHTAYSSAKFAVKGFSEALVVDLRLNAPHVKVSLVMPGHIGTSISLNAPRVLYGLPEVSKMTVEEMAEVREKLEARGIPLGDASDEVLKAEFLQQAEDFRDNAPMSAAEAVGIIIDGVRKEKWRILVGEDAHDLDRIVRRSPEEAYDGSIILRLLKAAEERGVDVTEQIAALLQPEAK
jgi:NAD(P)-dependent dehydrogenase (short-subunit alcohol dehydrogenase family)